MRVDAGRLKKQATVAATVACLGVFALGVLAFALALRPCRLELQPGMVIPYRLTTTTRELDQAGKPGPPRVEVRSLQLVCTGPDNEVAMILPAGAGAGGRDQVTLLQMTPDGAACRLDAAARPLDSGVAVGFFDFNLLPLPAGGDQPREITVTYAVLPQARNPVHGRVRRAKAGTKPTFQLKLQASVEWLGEGGRYHQIRDLVSTYRFNSAKGVIEQATVTLVAGVERDDGARRFAVAMELELDGEVTRTAQDPRRLREAVLASAEAVELLRENDPARSRAAAERLRAADISLPQLRALADRLSDAILAPQAQARAFRVRIARGPAAQRREAEALARRLIASGYPAGLHAAADSQIEVAVGPYPAPDPVVLAGIAKAFPDFTPTWESTP